MYLHSQRVLNKNSQTLNNLIIILPYSVYFSDLFQVFHAELYLVVVAVSAVIGHSRIVVEHAVVVAFGASNLGHPRYFASPNVCSFPSCSSSVGLARGVFAGSSIDVLPNDDPCSHSSNLTVLFYKRMGPFDSRPNLSHSGVSDTSVLATDATTSHCRKRCPHLRQGQHRHPSQV